LRVKLGAIDEIALDVHGTVLERLDVPGADVDVEAPDETGDDEDVVAGPIAIAVDMTDAEAPAAASADAPA
jgi:exoribonuclease-2